MAVKINCSKFLLLLFVFSQLFNLKTSAQNSDPDDYNLHQDIESVIQFFDQGRIDRAEHLALKILEDSEELSDDDRFVLYRTLAFCSIAVDDEESGMRRFVMALRYNPTLTPDPLIWSPKVRRVFDLAREEYERQMKLEHQQRYGKEAQLGRVASFKSLYFPGYGQHSKGQTTKGYILGMLFWGSAASFIYGQTELPGLKDSYRKSPTSTIAVQRWEDYRDMQYMVNVSGIIAVSVYTWAFLDALWSKPSQRVMDEISSEYEEQE